ncbi:MAG: carbohydrate kinase, partial [Verrucomicrobiaceae bacterium]
PLIALAAFASDLPPLDTPDLWQRALAALYAINGKPVVITLGERGLVHGTADNWKHLPAYPAAPVDTTGAGDIFHGAYAYGILRGLDVDRTLQLASMAAALSVQERGSSLSIPPRERVLKMLGWTESVK